MDQYKVTLRMLVPAASVYPSIAYAAECLLREIHAAPEARVWIDVECTMNQNTLDVLRTNDDARKALLSNLRATYGVTIYDVKVWVVE